MGTERATLRLPDEQYKKLDMLVEYGEFTSKSEAIRTAIYDMIQKRVRALLTRAELTCKKPKYY